jgi:hypothetical protein
MGADGAWWLLQSSKLARPDSVGLGGFDSHTLPPARSTNIRSHDLLSRLPAGVLAAVCAGVLLLAPGEAIAQQPDTTRAGAAPRTPRRRAPAAQPADSMIRPPLSPRRAFLYSLALPGLGQAKLDRPNAGALFVAVEILGVTMARKSATDLAYARRFATDTLVVQSYGPFNDQGVPTETTYVRQRYAGDRVKARRTHYEDWLALLIFNHLLSGADAFVAAQLWDLPGQVSVRAVPRGATVSASVAW